jgi:hypothetical protein
MVDDRRERVADQRSKLLGGEPSATRSSGSAISALLFASSTESLGSLVARIVGAGADCGTSGMVGVATLSAEKPNFSFSMSRSEDRGGAFMSKPGGT